MFKKSLLVALVLLTVFIIFQYFDTGSPDQLAHKKKYEIIAHRGVHQHYHKEEKDSRSKISRHELLYGCEATKMKKPTHQYIENTVDSIQAAFDYGATIVEIDIRPTKDNQLVVFHDGTLDCKTNGKGNIWNYTVEELKKLDVGYGYTYDKGITYPFRGKGVGGIKTFKEILQHFPNKKFLIDNKNGNNLKVAELIIKTISELQAEQKKRIYLWVNDKAYRYIHQRMPLIKRLLLTRKAHKKYFKKYIFSIGLIGIPEEYSGEGLGIPINYTKYVWGWPYKFLRIMDDADVRFYVYVNNQAEYDSISKLPVNGVITDFIETIKLSKGKK